MANAMDYSVNVQNNFAPFQTDMDGCPEGNFTLVQNKRKSNHKLTDPNTFSQTSVDEKFTIIYNDLQEIKERQANTNKGMDMIQNYLHRTRSDVVNVVKATNRSIDMMHLLAYKSIDIEARSRRNNLIFRNLTMKKGDSCFEIVRQFLDKELDLDGDNVYLERAHPFGPPKKQLYCRDIIVAFRDYGDTECIMNNVGRLRGTRYVIDRDYPREIVDARRRLWPKFKEAKAKGGLRVSIQFPAKLVINNSVVQDEFPDWYRVINSHRDIKLPYVNIDETPHSLGAPRSAIGLGVSSEAPQPTRNMYLPSENAAYSQSSNPSVTFVGSSGFTTGQPSGPHPDRIPPTPSVPQHDATVSNSSIHSVNSVDSAHSIPSINSEAATGPNNTQVNNASDQRFTHVHTMRPTPPPTDMSNANPSVQFRTIDNTNGVCTSENIPYLPPHITNQQSIFKSTAPSNIPKPKRAGASNPTNSDVTRSTMNINTREHKPRSASRHTSTRQTGLSRSPSASITRAKDQRSERIDQRRDISVSTHNSPGSKSD